MPRSLRGISPPSGKLYDPCRELTILRDRKSPADSRSDPATLALSALAWVLSDGDRAQRLLALTGLTPDALRDGLGEKAVQGAVLEFLTSHEPDLIAAAEDLGVEPRAIAEAAQRLGA